MKFLIAVALAWACMIDVVAQQNEVDELLYHGYLTRDETLIKKAIVINESALKKDNESKDLKYRLAVSRFTLLNSTMAGKDEDLYDDYEDDTEELLEELIEDDDTWGEPKALLSAKYGLDMAFTPLKGIFLGSKSSSMMESALNDAPSSPLVWKLYGNSKLFTPETYGGNVKEAIKAYQKAIVLYETQQKTRNNWMYLDVLAFLGQAYERTGDLTNAEIAYKKALTTEPGFGWVKNVLLPKLQQKQAAK